MRYPGILSSLHPQSRRGEQRTSQLRRIMVNATCGAAAALADFEKEQGERERDQERMSAGLAESGELWHPQHGQVTLYLTACPHRFNITLAALLRFALHGFQFISYAQESNTPLILLRCQGVRTENSLLLRDSDLGLPHIFTFFCCEIPPSYRLQSIP